MRLTAGLWALVMAAFMMAAPAGATPKRVQTFAESLAGRAISILENPDLSASGKQNQLENLFAKKVDLDWVARFVLGKHWRSASAGQRRDYLKHYKTFVISNFTEKLINYAGREGYSVRQVRPEGEEGEFLLTLEVQTSEGAPILIDYRIRRHGKSYLIFDIIVEGVSLITTQRSEFNSVVDRKGLDFLIGALEKRGKKS